MMNLHILLDPVSNFWKCPKKGFKKKLFTVFFGSEFYCQTCTIALTSHMRARCSALPALSHDHHGTLSRLYAMKTTFELIWITLFSEKWWMSAEVMKNYVNQYINIALICNVDISWHKFSIDCDKTWNKFPYCPLGMDSCCSLHGPATDHKSIGIIGCQLSLQSTQPPVHCVNRLVHGLDMDCSSRFIKYKH